MGRYVTLLLPPLAQPVPRVRGCVRVCARVCARAFPRSFARPHNGIRGELATPAPWLSVSPPQSRSPGRPSTGGCSSQPAGQAGPPSCQAPGGVELEECCWLASEAAPGQQPGRGGKREDSSSEREGSASQLLLVTWQSLLKESGTSPKTPRGAAVLSSCSGSEAVYVPQAL